MSNLLNPINYEEHLGAEVKDTKKAISISLSRTKDGETMDLVNDNSSETDPTVSMSEPLARVTIGMGRTINTGNYSSAKFDISVSLPCKVSELEETYQKAKEFCEQKGEQILKENELDGY